MIDKEIFVHVSANMSNMASAIEKVAYSLDSIFPRCQLQEGFTSIAYQHSLRWYISQERRYTTICSRCKRSAMLPRYFTLMESTSV